MNLLVRIDSVRFLAACLGLFLGFHGAAGGQLPEGLETSVGLGRVLAGSGNGNFALLQASDEGSGSAEELQIQVFDAEASPFGSPFQVPGAAECPEHTMGGGPASSSFLWLWSEVQDPTMVCGFSPTRTDLFARVYSMEGEPLSPRFQVNSILEGEHTFPGFAELPDGGWLLTWSQVTMAMNQDGDYISHQYVRRFDSDGTPREAEFRISESGMFDPLKFPVVTLLAGGGFSVVWSHFNSGGIGSLTMRSFDPSGTPVTAPTLLGEDSNSPFTGAEFVRLPDGATLVTWWGGHVFARFLDPFGQLRGDRFQVSTRSGFLGFSGTHAVVKDSGEVLVAWTLEEDPHSGSTGDGSGAGAFGQWISTTGDPLGNEFQINARFQGRQELEELRLTPREEPVALFGSHSGLTNEVFARRLRTSCTSGVGTLCLGEGGRFRVEVAWADASDRDGQAGAAGLSEESGYFWFFRPDNVELVVKVVDGGAVNGNFWVFYGALSNVEYQLTVTDTETGFQKIYHNPASNFASVGDTAAFPGGDLGGAEGASVRLSLSPAAIEALLPAMPQGSVADASSAAAPGKAGGVLEFAEGRFAASLDWEDFSGSTGTGHGVMLTSDTGYFWFFKSDRPEVVLKVLDGRSVNGHYWVFYGALSNVEYTLSVEDRQQNTTRTYFNPARHFGSVGDTEAFP
ncbi:MAG: hypothetical protein K0U98_23685 [Deltaproteobacteria bacterium]|nr:hypothetical protein [Deltaproteobacteria bacterium]